MSDLKKVKQVLLDLESALGEQIELGKEQAEPVALDSSIGRLSRMDAMQDQHLAIESQERRKVRLQRVQSALQRIERGTYGKCVRCREEINEPRLEAQPEVLLCLKCASTAVT